MLIKLLPPPPSTDKYIQTAVTETTLVNNSGCGSSSASPSTSQDKVSVSIKYFEESSWDQQNEPFCKKGNNFYKDQQQQQTNVK